MLYPFFSPCPFKIMMGYTLATVDEDWTLLSHADPIELPALTYCPSQRLELEWLLNELHETLQNLKSGLEDCYALLAPVDPGSTLVVSTPRNEIVKGHVTRVGTRIVKGVCLPSHSLRPIPDVECRC